jgi:shikimate kinase
MRLEDIKGRGVVLRNGQTLKDLYEERVPLYNKYADVVISEENLNVEQTVQKLSESVRQLKSNPKM